MRTAVGPQLPEAPPPHPRSFGFELARERDQPGQFEEAERLLREVLGLDPDCTQAHDTDGSSPQGGRRGGSFGMFRVVVPRRRPTREMLTGRRPSAFEPARPPPDLEQDSESLTCTC